MTVADPEPGVPHETTPKRRRRRRFSRAWLIRLGVAGASGYLYYLSFAPRPLWWLAPLAFTALALVLRGRSFRGAFGYGFVYGAAFFLALLTWLQDFLGRDFGPWPWLGLSLTLSLYFGLGALLIRVVARLPLAPLWGALAFVALETPRAWFPLGGFPWGRVAFSQPEGAYLSLASVGGAPLVGLAVVLSGFGLAALVARLWQHRRWRDRKLITPLVLTLLPVLAGLAVWPTVGTAAQDGSLTVAAIQGNAPDVGIALEGERDVLRRNHFAESAKLLGEIQAGQVPKPDLLVWPETATAVDGRAGDPAIDQMVNAFGVPAIIGTLYLLPDGTAENSAVVWNPRTGPGQRYVKQDLVPFGEYVPDRAIARLVTPFVDNTPDLRAGDGSNAALSVAGTKVGVFICYETAFDGPARDATDQGGELLVVPTNNAWYGPGEMSYQQLAMTRLRAVEHGRAAVVSATSGVSAIVAPDGTITSSTGLFTADALVGRVPLRTETTLSDRLGVWTEYGLLALAIAGVAGGSVLRFRPGRARAGTTAGEAAG
ncbi:MAG TPA: apolipoprotein N-acyltransferase [Amycolatopsis sp.]|nr:apolipoprotein N-acyltransferase [Amycolatopsis sp.]